MRPAAAGLTRAADCFLEGVVLVDASVPKWPVLYTNENFAAAAGAELAGAVGAAGFDLEKKPGKVAWTVTERESSPACRRSA